ALNDLGVLAFAERNIGQAMSLFSRVLEQDAGNPDALLNLAHCYRQRQEFPLALALYRKALPLSERPSSVLNEIGACCASLDDFESARAAFQESLLHDGSQQDVKALLLDLDTRASSQAAAAPHPDLSALRTRMDLAALNTEISKQCHRVRYR